ncbi:MAG TPA: beta-xylosidase, partial [Verrucomicrobiae bacterium]|nr:beta-xylosidase [Verrucomicrobiae bacterium]
SYWHGSHQDYFKLYDYAVEGVRRALPQARVGGPETAGGPGGKFLEQFLDHCAHGTNYVTGKIGSPLDFISFHAKGSTKFVDGHVEMGLANQFRDMNNAFAVIAASPEFGKLPVIIGESDPEGCAACTDPQDGYRNGTQYASYTAASIAREYQLAQKHGVNLQGALTWAFEFEGQPPFAGFRALATDGIDLPVLNVFRLFSKMSGERVAVDGGTGYDAEKILRHGVRGNPDVSGLAAYDSEKGRVTVMVWNYADDDVPGPEAAVDLALDGLPMQNGRVRVTEFRIDTDHSDAFAAWQRMGSPLPLSKEQYATLEKAGQLAPGTEQKLRVANGRLVIPSLRLPRQAVSLVVIDDLGPRHWFFWR